MDNMEERLKAQFNRKKVLIVGLGLQGGGVGLAKFFTKLGTHVTVTDKKTRHQLVQSINRLEGLNVRLTLGKHEERDFLDADVIFKAPKMRWDDPLIQAAQKKGIQIEMETSFFAKMCPAPIVGITGTRGKSTTTTMIYELLKKNSGKTIHLAGNLPEKLAINLLLTIKPDDIVVLELSSWQLSGFHRKKISPHISVFTNFYPDHYDYYKTEEEYLYDKKAIYLYQKPEDHIVINEALKPKISADTISSHIHFFSYKLFPQPLFHLKGGHNLENAAAALTVAKLLNLDLMRTIETIKSFKGLPYRQEVVVKKDWITFVNDTTSTTPTATVKALEAFSNSPVILILGGNSKKLPTNVLINQLIKADKIILLKGSFTDEILPLLQKKYKDKISFQYGNLAEAVKAAYHEAVKLKSPNKKSKPVTVLFSPGATSFAMFNNEFHRGDEFNKIVKNLL